MLALGAGRAEAPDQDRERDCIPSALVALRMAHDNPQAATVSRWPDRDDPASTIALGGWLVQSLLLEAIACDSSGQATAAEQALERGLDLARHDRAFLPFLVHPVQTLLNRYAKRRTVHLDLIAEISELVAGIENAPALRGSKSLREPLTDSEVRVLRYLPTNLSNREIGRELYVPVNTIKTHVKHIYAKLDVETRRQAVERARALGLLGHSSRNRRASSCDRSPGPGAEHARVANPQTQSRTARSLLGDRQP